MAFATLHEAWGVSSFEQSVPKPVVPERKPFDKAAGQYKLAAPTPTPAAAAAVLRGIFYERGLPGLSHAAGMQFVRDVVTAASRNQQPRRKPTDTPYTLDNESALMILIGLFSLVVFMDAL
jgi:hypothetical protein